METPRSASEKNALSSAVPFRTKGCRIGHAGGGESGVHSQGGVTSLGASRAAVPDPSEGPEQ
jgi:hypothetical protein